MYVNSIKFQFRYTKKILSERMIQHSKDKNSALFAHHKSTVHEIDYDNVSILDRADSDYKLRLKELLHIEHRNPTLNKQLNVQEDTYRIGVNIIGSRKKK